MESSYKWPSPAPSVTVLIRNVSGSPLLGPETFSDSSLVSEVVQRILLALERPLLVKLFDGSRELRAGMGLVEALSVTEEFPQDDLVELTCVMADLPVLSDDHRDTVIASLDLRWHRAVESLKLFQELPEDTRADRALAQHVHRALGYDVLQHVHPALLGDRSFMEQLVKRSKRRAWSPLDTRFKFLELMTEPLRSDGDFALSCVDVDAALLLMLPEKFRQDDRFLAVALSRNARVLQHIPPTWPTWSHLARVYPVREFWMSWLECGCSRQEVPDRLMSDQEFQEALVRRLACRKLAILSSWRQLRTKGPLPRHLGDVTADEERLLAKDASEDLSTARMVAHKVASRMLLQQNLGHLVFLDDNSRRLLRFARRILAQWHRQWLRFAGPFR